jgi:hypothetical protein
MKISIFSAINKKEARGFLFAWKIQTREKKTDLFYLTKTAGV